MTEAEVEKIVDELSERTAGFLMKGRSPDDCLSAEEAVVHWSCIAYGAIENGGLRGLYEDHRLVLHDLASFFERLGLDCAADAIRDVNAQFPGGKPMADPDEFFKEQEKIDFKQLRWRQAAIFAIEWQGLRKAIGTFITENPRGFRIAGIAGN
jgi:hypothetical protein